MHPRCATCGVRPWRGTARPRRNWPPDTVPPAAANDLDKKGNVLMAPSPIPAAIAMQGKRALVTGAASGIGKATALVLADLGASLLLCDRAPLDDVRDQVRARGN